MEFSRDRVRRALAESQEEHETSLPRWRESLARAFDPDSRATEAEKSRLLGIPDRRTFFRVGGVTLAMSAVVAACGKSKVAQIAQTGTTTTTAKGATTTSPYSRQTDKAYLRTAQSIEVLAIETYQSALDSGLVTTASVVDAVKLFQSQHREHNDLLARTVQGVGGEPYAQANAYLKSAVIDAAVAGLSDEKSVIVLAQQLETVAANTYTMTGGVLTTPELRQTALSIGGTEARHMAALNELLELPPVPTAFMPTRNAVDKKGYISVT